MFDDGMEDGKEEGLEGEGEGRKGALHVHRCEGTKKTGERPKKKKSF